MLQNSLLQLKRALKNEDGIALVTSLMLTLITLGIILSIMYMITLSTQRAGANKRYKTVLEASYGGAEIFSKDMIPYLFQNYSSNNLSTSLQASYGSTFDPSVATQPNWQKCLQIKMSQSTATWPAYCSATLSPKSQPDIKLTLQGANNQPFTIYSKIVDTIAGNTDTSGLQLEGSGVAESTAVITPQHLPYVYRLEVQAERSTNVMEKSNISVLYAY